MKVRRIRTWLEDNWLEVALCSIFLVEMVAWKMDVVPYTIIRSMCEEGGKFLIASIFVRFVL